MMTHTELIARFSDSINWNGISYGIYRFLYTGFSLSLYHTLDTCQFSAWANINSFIFLLLLWLNCGFRKSIPRFIPEVLHDKNAHIRLIRMALTCQISIICIAIPLFIPALSFFLTSLSIPHTPQILAGAAALFCADGILSVLRLVYHAHFLNKEFNAIYTVITVVQMLMNALLLYHFPADKNIIFMLFCTHAALSTCTILITSFYLARLRRLHLYPTTDTVLDYTAIRKLFTIHSLYFWAGSIIKSCFDRNVIVPFLTYAIGAGTANLYKVANDCALLFYRFVLKTIGTTDTALFSYARVNQSTQNIAFFIRLLLKKICILSLIIFSFFACAAIVKAIFTGAHTLQDPLFLLLFFALTGAYFLEIILSPFERILEVDRKYLSLAYAYTSYLIGAFLLMLMPLSFLQSIIIIHATRLAFSIIVMHVFHIHYPFRTPFLYLYTTIFILLCIGAII